MNAPSWLIRFLPYLERYRAETELDEELRLHLELETQENLDRGMPPADAARRAKVWLGSRPLIREDTRAVWGWVWLDALWQDVRCGVRSLGRDRGFISVAVLTLALGIGVNTVVFSVIRPVLLEPLPYDEPDRLVMLWTTIVAEDVQEARSAFANVEDWRRQSRAFTDIAVYDPVAATLTDGSGPERVGGVRVSPNFFSLLGVDPAIGRGFTAAEAERQERLIVLSDPLWQRRFGADPDILGQSISIDGEPSRIIGVMPAGFRFPSDQAAFWEPHTRFRNWNARRVQRGTDTWFVLGRLAPEASHEDAQVELSVVAARLEQAFPADNQGLGVRVVPLHDQLTGGQLRTALWALWGAVGFVLLITCANVANLLLARGAARRKEMAIRAAIGAGRGRLVRLVLAESLVLGALGGMLGTAAALWSLEVLPLGAGSIPRLEQASVDGVVLTFSLGLALVTGVIFGILPGLEASRPDLNAALGEGGRNSRGLAGRRVRKGLVVAELALALITLTGAGLLGRSLIGVLSLDLGFDASRVLYAQVAIPPERSAIEQVEFYREVIARTARLGGIEAVGAIDDLFISNTPDRRLTIEGQTAAPARTRPLNVDEITPGFFRTMGVPLMRGRSFTERDDADSLPVAVINETMARRYWPDADPLGQRLQLGEYRPERPWVTVVGVVGDFRRSGPEAGTLPQLFRPHAQQPSRSMNLLVRSVAADPLTVVAALRAQVAAVDPEIPVYLISTLEQRVDRYASQRRFQTRLLTVFAAAALLLAAIGTYGLISHSVHQRTGEIGVRVALGATHVDILRLVIREGMFVTAIGIGAGLAGALVVARGLRSLLFEVSPADPVTLLGVCLLLVGTALLSCYIPARRAARLDPVAALRGE
ncbi:MAG: ABC transporter permease [Gemmatimonadales bacterium]